MDRRKLQDWVPGKVWEGLLNAGGLDPGRRVPDPWVIIGNPTHSLLWGYWGDVLVHVHGTNKTAVLGDSRAPHTGHAMEPASWQDNLL